MFFDRRGAPMSQAAWMAAFGPPDERRVALTELEGASVSTVWLGLDHSHDGAVPLIFETMVFIGDEGTECWRWPTEEAALAGHDRVVAELRARSR